MCFVNFFWLKVAPNHLAIRYDESEAQLPKQKQKILFTIYVYLFEICQKFLRVQVLRTLFDRYSILRKNQHNC